MTTSKYTTIALNDNEKGRLDGFATSFFEEPGGVSYAEVVNCLVDNRE